MPDLLDKTTIAVKFDQENTGVKSTKREETFGCIIAIDGEAPDLQAALESLGLRVCYSTDGKHLPQYVPDECDVVFVCREFSGPVFQYLRSSGLRIVGPSCVFSCAKLKKPLPNSVRPVYSTSMEGAVVCFTGFKDKEELHTLCDYVHMMGGSIRKEITSSVTHVVAHSVSGSKYKMAVGFGTPIMSEQWVTKAWESKDTVEVSAIDEILMQYKQFPFAGCTMAFLGFTEEEEEHMKDIAIDNGAEVKVLGSSGVTHLVVANELDSEDIPVVSSRVSVVKVQWFWESIQIEACADEALYLAKDAPCKKKRKRQSSAVNTSGDRSGIDVSLFSITSSLCSLNTPTKTEGIVTASETCSSPSPKDTARYHITKELLETESNFVNVLQIVITFFKIPLENPTMRGGPIIAAEDIKGIFANIDEILMVHERIMANLRALINSWTDGTCIGTVLLDEADELVKVYPRFVNFFEISKETLHRCDKQCPRFHAFLKANESRPECARQTIEDLLITPVQRLPRIILLLQDLIKHTDQSHRDYSNLQKALQSLRNVMTHINEDKRKTEGQVQMFEVLRDIEECPALILSANRNFLCKVDVMDMASSKATKSENLVLYLFSDSIEIAKKKSLGTFSRSSKQFRHIEFFSLLHCRAVVSFTDAPDMVGLLVRWPDDPEHEKVLVFKLISAEPDSASVFAQQVCKQLANLHYMSHHEMFLIHSTADAVMSTLSKKPGSSSSLKKAISGAKKKVKRVFSGKSHRKPLLNLPLHSNMQTMDEDETTFSPALSPSASILEPPDSPGNQSIISTQSLCTFTSVLDLRTPQAKRAAIARSFGAADKKGSVV